MLLQESSLVPVRFPLAELCFLHENAYFKNEKQDIIVKKKKRKPIQNVNLKKNKNP